MKNVFFIRYHIPILFNIPNILTRSGFYYRKPWEHFTQSRTWNDACFISGLDVTFISRHMFLKFNGLCFKWDVLRKPVKFCLSSWHYLGRFACTTSSNYVTSFWLNFISLNVELLLKNISFVFDTTQEWYQFWVDANPVIFP